MKFNILIGGDAGQGINVFSNLLGEVIARCGLYAFNYRDYKSLIRGGHSFNVITISDSRIESHESGYDIVLAMHPDTIKIHKKHFKPHSVLLHHFPGFKEGIYLDTEKFSTLVKTMVFAGALLNVLGLNKEAMLKLIEEKFGKKSIYKQDVEAFNLGYNGTYKIHGTIKLVGTNKKHYLGGAEGVAIGAIESGLDVYFAYPMTPSTSMLNILASKQYKHNFIVTEPENEIAVANAALGASFTGARTMLGTAGGGFDLMAEAMSMQGMSELPLVVYMAQRPGPGTGVPTYQQQADLNQALNIGHGEFPRVVAAPGDVQQSYRLAKEAFYLANKFGILSIILTDKHLVESGYTIDSLQHHKTPTYKKFNKVPGKNSIFRATSYEHNLNGDTVEDAGAVSAGVRRRLRKWSELRKEVGKLKTFNVSGNQKSKKLIIYWGSTLGVIRDASHTDKKNKYLQVIYMEPFSEALKREIKKHKESDIYIIESNTTSQLSGLIARHTGIMIPNRNKFLKYDARPFTTDEVEKWIQKI